jgi:dihydrofolate reductase
MRKTTLIMTMSIDGYVGAPDGMATGNAPEAQELKRWKLDRISRAGAHLMGRVTYEAMALFWPQSKDDYAKPMNDIPKVVFSKSLERAAWPTSTIARGDIADEVAALKTQPGGELIVWGGASFAQAMARVCDHHAPDRLWWRKTTLPRPAQDPKADLARHRRLRRWCDTSAVQT